MEDLDALTQSVVSKHGFTLIKKIGGGGSGYVYLAKQESLSRYVAIKFIKLSSHDGMNLDKYKRFEREAFLLSRCRGSRLPYLITININSKEVLPYMVMEYIEGPTLRDIMDNGGFFEDEKLAISIESNRSGGCRKKRKRADLRDGRAPQTIGATQSRA